jgi:hypothetical protein
MTKSPEEIYGELVEDVREREQELQENDLETEAAGVAGLLERPVETWEDNEKSLRTAPVIVAYEESGHGVQQSAREMLTGLDASINVLDDIIDTQDLGKQEKVELTANAAFSGMLAFGSTPEQYQDEVRGVVTQYLTELFQIPMVEERELGRVRGSDSVEDALDPSCSSYGYRARDIDAFSQIPSVMNGIEYPNSLTEDLRSFRAKELVLKDVHDVPRDLEDGDITPVIEIMDMADSEEEAYQAVRNLVDSFEYTQEGEQTYGEQLDQMLPELERSQFCDFMDRVNDEYEV